MRSQQWRDPDGESCAEGVQLSSHSACSRLRALGQACHSMRPSALHAQPAPVVPSLGVPVLPQAAGRVRGNERCGPVGGRSPRKSVPSPWQHARWNVLPRTGPFPALMLVKNTRTACNPMNSKVVVWGGRWDSNRSGVLSSSKLLISRVAQFAKIAHSALRVYTVMYTEPSPFLSQLSFQGLVRARGRGHGAKESWFGTRMPESDSPSRHQITSRRGRPVGSPTGGLWHERVITRDRCVESSLT